VLRPLRGGMLPEEGANIFFGQSSVGHADRQCFHRGIGGVQPHAVKDDEHLCGRQRRAFVVVDEGMIPAQVKKIRRSHRCCAVMGTPRANSPQAY